MGKTLVASLNTVEITNPEGNVYDSIFKQYEDVVINSLITSFGLDLFIQKNMDKHGGDVDTVLNVRKVGADPEMTYKNSKNEKAYNAREEYNPTEYHGNSNFAQKKHEKREEWQTSYKDIEDEYTGGKVGFYGHTQSIGSDRKAELDHIIECKGINEDRGRVLSGLSGSELANADENLAFTNKGLNASMGAWARGVNEKYKREHGCDAPLEMTDIRAYVTAHPDLDENTKNNLLAKYDKARKAYDAKINANYYTSKQFFVDAGKSAMKLGVTMGVRQALGLVFSEIWFAVSDVIKSGKETSKSLFTKIGEGVKQGLVNAKRKYKEIWNKFVEGSLSGVLSSITTTICNIFFTTAKNLVRIIRQTWASLVEALKIILFNPDCLPFGERFRAASKIIATGASVVVGSLVGDAIANTGIATIPVVGDIVQTFVMTLVTGVMSCSLLYILDHNTLVNKIVDLLNNIPTIDTLLAYYQQQAALLEEYCAKLEDIDISKFKEETKKYANAVKKLDNIKDQYELNAALRNIYTELNIPLPYEGYDSFNSFMNDKSSCLKFC